MIYVIILILIGLLIMALLLLEFQKFKRHGHIVVTEKDGKKLFSLELGIDPDEIEKYKYITFKVLKKDPDEIE